MSGSTGTDRAGAEGDDPTMPKRVIRTVTPPYRGRRDTEMSVIGWGYFLGLIVLLVPLLPFIVIVWLLSKAMEALRGR